MKKVINVIICMVSFLLSLNAYALELDKVRKGCKDAFENFSQIAPENVVQQTLNETIGVTYSDSVSYCLEMAKTINRGLDEKVIDLGGPKKASINQIVTIIGKGSRDPVLFTRKDKKCSLSSDKPAEANCSAGCLNYYLLSEERDEFLGFASAFNMSFHAARYKLLNMKHILPEIGRCSDSKKDASSASCAFNYCTVIHSSYQKTK